MFLKEKLISSGNNKNNCCYGEITEKIKKELKETLKKNGIDVSGVIIDMDFRNVSVQMNVNSQARSLS